MPGFRHILFPVDVSLKVGREWAVREPILDVVVAAKFRPTLCAQGIGTGVDPDF